MVQKRVMIKSIAFQLYLGVCHQEVPQKPVTQEVKMGKETYGLNR
jgi:hypothetical protein